MLGIEDLKTAQRINEDLALTAKSEFERGFHRGLASAYRQVAESYKVVIAKGSEKVEIVDKSNFDKVFESVYGGKK